MSTTTTREIGHGHRDDFAMFSDEGNRAVSRMVLALLDEVAQLEKQGVTLLERALYAKLTDGMNAIERTPDPTTAGETFSEVWDTAVRECIIGRIEKHTGRDLSIHF